MSIGMAEKQVLYDNPCAPIVKFAQSSKHTEYNEDDDDDDDEEEDMNEDQTTNHHLSHSTVALSLEDLVQSFDNTINACFADQPIIESKNENKPLPTESLVSTSSTWSELITNLRTSLHHDLKLPHIAQNCQTAMNSVSERNTTEDQLTSIDDLNEDEEEELREQLDMHSVIVSSDSFLHEPFLTAEQVISEIDFMLQDMTPDSGYCDNLLSSRHEDFDWKSQSIQSINQFYEELNTSIKDLSSTLVQELAIRDELEDEKECRNTFISLVHDIQNKRRHYSNEKRQKRRSLLGKHIEPGTYLTTVIPYDCNHPTYLSVEHLQSLNQILQAINEDCPQVPELLTNYILKVLCPC